MQGFFFETLGWCLVAEVIRMLAGGCLGITNGEMARRKCFVSLFGLGAVDCVWYVEMGCNSGVGRNVFALTRRCVLGARSRLTFGNTGLFLSVSGA